VKVHLFASVVDIICADIGFEMTSGTQIHSAVDGLVDSDPVLLGGLYVLDKTV
jgi:hypothetical protein